MKHLTLRLWMAGVCLLMPWAAAAQAGDTWYYGTNGSASYWQYEPDVYVFRCVGGAAPAMTFDPAVVGRVDWRAGERDRCVVLEFTPGSTAVQRQGVVNAVRLNGQYEADFPVVTRDVGLPAAAQRWWFSDDLLLVVFRDAGVSAGAVQAFAGRQGLHLLNPKPASVPAGVSWTYIFRMEHVRPSRVGVAHLPGSGSCISLYVPPGGEAAHLAHGDYIGVCAGETDPYVADAFRRSREIVDSEPMVLHAQPNIANMRSEVAVQGSPGRVVTNADLAGSNPGACGSADPGAASMWNIENVGGTLYNGSPTMTAGADANVCPCWAAGLTGNDVPITVIAQGDWYFGHEDMPTVYEKWDCSTGNCVPGLADNPAGGSGGMLIAGIIGAQRNNGYGGVGVAYNSPIHAIKVGQSMASFTAGLQLMYSGISGGGLSGTRIVVTDWMDFDDDQAMRQALDNVRQNCNPGTEVSIICGTGGFNTPTPPGVYPALDTITFSLISSTPNDLKKEGFDGWGTGVWAGSNSSAYEMSAPGVSILSPWSRDTVAGQDLYLQTQTLGTGAVGTAAGVMALIMEWDIINGPGVWNVYRYEQLLRAGADKIGPYTYASSQHGTWSLQAGYGRVDCGNSLDILTARRAAAQTEITVVSPAGDVVTVQVPAVVQGTVQAGIYDAGGREVYAGVVQVAEGRLALPAAGLAEGLYLLRLQGDGFQYSEKFLK